MLVVDLSKLHARTTTYSNCARLRLLTPSQPRWRKSGGTTRKIWQMAKGVNP